MKIDDEITKLSDEMNLSKRIADEFHRQFVDHINSNKDYMNQFIELLVALRMIQLYRHLGL